MTSVDKKKISEQLQQNAPPDIDPEIRAQAIQSLTAEAVHMDMLPRQSVLEQLLTQASYLSPWMWLMQFLLAGALLFLPVSDNMREIVLPCCLLLSPEMTILLICQLARSFSHNMWEMESSCRYSLPRILAMRLCLMSGTDLLVLASVLVLFCRMDYPLWSFALMVMLPFFLSSALCMGLLGHYAHMQGGLAARLDYTLYAAAMVFHVLLTPLLNKIILWAERLLAKGLRKAIALATLLALFLFIAAAVKHFRKEYQHEDGRLISNF